MSVGACGRRGLTTAGRYHDSLGWVGSCGLLGSSPLRGAAARSAAFLVPEVVWPGAPHAGPSAPSLQLTQPHAVIHHSLVPVGPARVLSPASLATRCWSGNPDVHDI